MKRKYGLRLEDMQELKMSYGLSCEQIATGSELPLPTVQKIFGGITKAPRYKTLRSLEDFFLKLGDSSLSDDFISSSYKEDPHSYEDASPMNGIFHEPSGYEANTVKKSVSGYTIRDYELLPDSRRTELIDGIFYDMSAPSLIHQMITARIWAQLDAYIASGEGACISFFAPVDVQLDEDDHTMVQPDIVLVCDPTKYSNRKRIIGAPDLIMEILSDATRKRDFGIKAHKYIDAGVREYWIIDPDRQCVYVYDIENGPIINIYDFDESVPLGIYQGRCSIDFRRITQALKQIADSPTI